MLPIKPEVLNVIPHVFWPDKPDVNFGNVYAHETGLAGARRIPPLASPSAPPQRPITWRWVGVLVVAPLLWFLLFVVSTPSLETCATPWGLLAVAMLAHAAPESQLTGLVHLITFGTEILVFSAFFGTWVAPILASTVLGPDRRRAAPQISFLPGARGT